MKNETGRESGMLVVASVDDRRNRRRSRGAIWGALGALLAVGIFSGCTSVRVQPWQRATLTDYSMRPDRDPLATASSEHTYFSREAATGGRGVGGSGCGCN